MSESRQRFTGRGWQNAAFIASWAFFLWILLNTLPLFTTKLQIYQAEPWMLTPEDLTWKRMVFNILSKSGIKTMIFSAAMTGIIIQRWQRSGGRILRRKRTKMPRMSFSLEWVIDSKKSSSLIEYGNFVEAV